MSVQPWLDQDLVEVALKLTGVGFRYQEEYYTFFFGKVFDLYIDVFLVFEGETGQTVADVDECQGGSLRATTSSCVNVHRSFAICFRLDYRN